MQIPSTWLRTIKPKGFFERRKSPAGDSGEIQIKPDYHQALHKSTNGVEMEHREIPHDPTFGWPIKLIIVMVLLGLVAALIWLYFKH